MIIVTTEFIPGRRILSHVGLVRGNTIRARFVGNDLMAALRHIASGEIREYPKMMGESREQAIDRMIEEAEALGADAIIAVRFQTSMVMKGAAEILAYGTAVVAEEDAG